MTKIEKEKNLLKIYVDGKTDRPYIFNISNGELLGLKGSPVKRTPAGIPSAFSNHFKESNLIQCVYIIHECYRVNYADFSEWVEYLEFWDKVDSLNLGKIAPASRWEMTNKKMVAFANENFKEYAKWANENERLSLEKFYNEMAFSMWCAKYGITIDEYTPEEMVKAVMNARFDTPEKIKYAIYQIRRGLFDFLSSFSYSDAISKLVRYFDYCNRLGVEYEKGDFIKNYVSIKKRYEFRKIELDNEKLAENQLKHKEALTFSYGNYETIIPTTCAEFHEEAEMQNNCVERMYLEKVVDGRTNVVFVRKKDDLTKSYITCEVKNGSIWQFLLRFNSTPRDLEDIEFQNAFQNHLNEMWSKGE